jgi:hypothetical protein
MAARIATPGHWREAKKADKGWVNNVAFPTPRSPPSRSQQDNKLSSIILITLNYHGFESLLSSAIDNKLTAKSFTRRLISFPEQNEADISNLPPTNSSRKSKR